MAYKRAKKQTKKTPTIPEPPATLSQEARGIWEEVCELHGSHARMIVGPLLEEFCEAVAVLRDANRRVAEEGLVVSDPKGMPIDHPALKIAGQAQRTVERLASRFAPPVDRRRRGYLVEKTWESVHAAKLDEHEMYSAAVAGVVTLAHIIDDAQSLGSEVFRKMAFGPVQSYLNGLEQLGLTPKLSAVDRVEAGEEKSDSGEVVSVASWIAGRGA